METLRLTEQEQKFYGELFAQCDVESSGDVSHLSAEHLFATSGVPREILNKIRDLCGVRELGYFTQTQFYIALKLIAVVQSGMSLTLESLQSGHELPLPAFGTHMQTSRLVPPEDTNSKLDTLSITSSETDSVEDVWSITGEQREYYVKQFSIMQPDVRGVISGAVAKEFFEKSKLPISELSKIWQLSDVNRDGALSLEEFCTAMHLVVLRRNEIELPDTLPLALIPSIPLNPDEPYTIDLYGNMLKPSPSSPGQWISNFVQPQHSPASSSVSSPGSKPTPVNFDYKPIIADAESKIVHPVALRMSPDGLAVNSDAFDDAKPLSSLDQVLPAPDVPVPGWGDTAMNKGDSIAAMFGDAGGMMPHNHAGVANDFMAMSTSVSGMTNGNDNEQVKHVKSQEENLMFADSGPLIQTNTDSKTPPDSKKDERRFTDNFEPITSTPAKGLMNQSSLDHYDMRDNIRKQRLKNITLSRLNNELNQELQEVMEQRIALEIQLEHLRPFHS